MKKQIQLYNHPFRFFKKRTYTFRTFFKDILKILGHRHYIRDTHQSKRISKRFSEHIMLVVTGINDCIYCEWGHSNFALRAGSSKPEIEALLSQQFRNFPSDEIAALVFAQHYAESSGYPSKEALSRLIKEYGKEKGRDIIIFCEMITVGNLLGNSISAFLSRLKGIPPEHGSIFFEIIVFLCGGFLFDRYMNRNR
ncbi:MAG: carboxymuconolactone decarboxylase family protein [Promethearchaeota archaeon]